MDVREKLVDIFTSFYGVDPMYYGVEVQPLVDHLIAHGATVQELDGCIRCKESQQMTVAISNKLVDGVDIGWLGGNLPAKFCPFCGRRLPKPPKGE